MRRVSLTPRQATVLQALANGCTTKDIARRLHVQPAAISAHVGSAKRRMHAETTYRLMVLAAVGGYINVIS